MRVDGTKAPVPKPDWFVQLRGQQLWIATQREDLAPLADAAASDEAAAVALLDELAGDGRIRMPAREWGNIYDGAAMARWGMFGSLGGGFGSRGSMGSLGGLIGLSGLLGPIKVTKKLKRLRRARTKMRDDIAAVEQRRRIAKRGGRERLMTAFGATVGVTRTTSTGVVFFGAQQLAEPDLLTVAESATHWLIDASGTSEDAVSYAELSAKLTRLNKSIEREEDRNREKYTGLGLGGALGGLSSADLSRWRFRFSR